jgi:hypothetical protein
MKLFFQCGYNRIRGGHGEIRDDISTVFGLDGSFVVQEIGEIFLAEYVADHALYSNCTFFNYAGLFAHFFNYAGLFARFLIMLGFLGAFF